MIPNFLVRPKASKHNWMTKPPCGTQIDWTNPLSRDLVGCWLFNEGSGTRSNDLSRNNNHGTLTNFGAGSATSGWTGGKSGTALKFDGVDDYVNAGNAASLNTTITKTTPYTIEAWAYIKSDETVNGRTIVSFSVDADNRHGIMFRDGEIRSGIYNGTSYFVKKSGIANLNTWYHVVVTFDGSTTFNLYLNSVLQTGINSPFLSPVNNLVIGADSEGAHKFFNGSIDEVRIWNRALSSQEIQQLYIHPYYIFKY